MDPPVPRTGSGLCTDAVGSPYNKCYKWRADALLYLTADFAVALERRFLWETATDCDPGRNAKTVARPKYPICKAPPVLREICGIVYREYVESAGHQKPLSHGPERQNNKVYFATSCIPQLGFTKSRPISKFHPTAMVRVKRMPEDREH